MSTATTIYTRPGPVRRFIRWVHLRQLRAEIRTLEHTIQALETGTEADRLRLNQLARMGMKNLVLRSRYEHEMQELFGARSLLERTRKELSDLECVQ